VQGAAKEGGRLRRVAVSGPSGVAARNAEVCAGVGRAGGTAVRAGGRRGKAALALSALMGALVVGAGGCSGESAAAMASATTPAPINATAADVRKAVADARGNVVLVNVWATWCDPCRHEFPALLRVRRELTKRKFRLILVSADFADHLPEVRQFLTQQGVSFPTYLKAQNDMEFINALDPRWSGALPATFLYDRAGKLRDFWEGEASYAAIARKVHALLAGAPQGGAEGGSK
jgi:thiol-disulfide isomerase/thioredoxin